MDVDSPAVSEGEGVMEDVGDQVNDQVPTSADSPESDNSKSKGKEPAQNASSPVHKSSPDVSEREITMEDFGLRGSG